MDRTTLIRAALGSACIPVFQPPIAIPKGGNPVRQYLDGGAREFAPLNIALLHGATELYVVVLSPKSKQVENGRYSSIPAILMRSIDLMCREILANDIDVARRHQEALQYVEGVRKQIKDRFGLSDGDVASLFNPASITNPFVVQTSVTIHVIQPEKNEDVVLDTLEFKPKELKQMMEFGRQRANAVLN